MKELELRTRQMTLLNEMGSLLECSGTVKEPCDVVANSVQKLFPEAPSGALYLFKSSRNLVEAVLRWGTIGLFLGAYILARRLLVPTSWPAALERAAGNGHLLPAPSHRVQPPECLCVPDGRRGTQLAFCISNLRAQQDPGWILGGYTFGTLITPGLSVASQVALSLASLQLRETLREQSIRDPLTRLFNRRFLEESLERELQIANRKKQSIAVLFLDLDHFKRFNDTFGHDAGDMVLQSLADLFRTFFRATDICCRYGGEEFAIVLPESSSQDAVIRAEALRSEVKSLDCSIRSRLLGCSRFSAGVAAFPEHGSTSDELLKIADQCLYESKARGRDIVTAALPQDA